MANFPLKMAVSFLQRRCLQTKASALVKKSSKPAKISKISSKTKDADGKLLPEGKKADSVIAYLRSQQFSDAHIDKLIERCPRILNVRLASNLEPKLRFLNENGFTGTLLPEIIISNPVILRRSLNAHLIPSLELLKTQLGKGNELALCTVVRRASWILTSDLDKVLRPNIMCLEKEGMPMSGILKLFTSQPRCLLFNIDRMLYGVQTVKKFGIKPYEPMFVHALRVVLSMGESNLKKKFEVFKSLGWSDADIKSSIVSQPLCLTCSKEKLTRNVEFFVKTMKVEPETIIANPKLVMYSLKKRIVPRYKVLKLLQEKKLVRKRMINSIMSIPERDFATKYVLRYMDSVPQLWDVYNGDSKLDAVAIQK